MASRRASWDSDNGIVDEDMSPATDKAETAGPAFAPAGDISDSGADGAVMRATLLTLIYKLQKKVPINFVPKSELTELFVFVNKCSYRLHDSAEIDDRVNSLRKPLDGHTIRMDESDVRRM
jgi:hypothetical protein